MHYTNFAFAAATKFVADENGVWSLVDTNGDGSPDLVYIKTKDTKSVTVEVHTSRNESLFQENSISTASAFPISDGARGTWLLRDWTGDGKADLVYIKTQETGSNKVEINIADAASNYHTFVLQTATVFEPEENGVWTLSDKGDLIYIKTRHTESGLVEVHVASRSSNYLTFTHSQPSSLQIESESTYAIAPKSSGDLPDLYCISMRQESSGKVRLAPATAQTKWQSGGPHGSMQTGIGQENNGTWCLAHFSHQREPDLVYIKTRNTASGQVEVYVVEPYALQPNSFLATSQDIRLEDGRFLRGRLQRRDGSYRNAEVDLDSLIGNTNGRLDFGTQGFSGSARNVKLTKTSLTAELKTISGSWEEDSIDIGERIFNNDGAFKAVDFPVIIAIPKGDEASFLDSLGKALREGTTELEVSNEEPDGSTIWHYKASASSSVDSSGFFRTYGAEVKASIFNVAVKNNHKILDMDFNFFSAGASAQTDRLENFKIQATYVGAEAHYNVVEGRAGALNFNVGLGAEAGIGFKDKSIDLDVGVIGVTLGKKVGVTFLGSSISVDFGVIWDTLSDIF